MKKIKKLEMPAEKTIDDLLEIVKVSNGGIVQTKTGYFAMIEVPPINFKLKSEKEQEYVIKQYEVFLKTIRTPFMIFTISKKADSKEHLDFMQRQYNTELNENVKAMIKEYQEYVGDISFRKAVRKRYLIAIPYVPPAGMKTSEMAFHEIELWMAEKKIQFRDALMKCGNELEIPVDEKWFAAQILFELLNVKSSERERMAVL